MPENGFLRLRAMLFLVLALAGPYGALGQRPNIVFILIDDQRYDFLRFLDHPWIETPNIDRLAERSVYLSNAFVTTSLCSPSRASILSGQYVHTHGVMDNDTPLPEGTPTFPRELQRAGYRTAFVGKWHMGGGDDRPRPGFDHWVSFRGQGPYTDPTLNVNGTRVARQGYTPDILTDYAVDFLRDQAGEEGPWFLYLSHKSIHENFTPAPRHRDAYTDLEVPRPPSFADTGENREGKPRWLLRQRRSWHGAERDFSIQEYGDFDRFFQLYSACMLAVDDSVGELVAELEAQGILDQTVIIYYSDNGYLMGEQGLIDKRVMHDPSIRVPAFVHAPDLLPEPRMEDGFALNIDIAPTLLDLAGAPVPATMQGRSWLPLLRATADDWRQSFLYEYFVDPFAPQTPTILGVRTREYSYMTYPGVWDVYELYDMKVDPGQRHNLLGSIKMGHNYGTFLQQIERQRPDLFSLVDSLDAELNRRLEATGGVRRPRWQKP